MQERARQPINITKWAMFYSFDVIGEVAFSKDFGNLMTGTEHSALIPIHKHIKALGVLSPVPWLMNLLTCLPSASNVYSEILAFCADEIRAKKKVTLLCTKATLVLSTFTDLRAVKSRGTVRIFRATSYAGW